MITTRTTIYNYKANGRLWSPDDLPSPLKSLDPASLSFAREVVRLQREFALVTDGMLGPRTIAAIRCLRPPSSAGDLPAATKDSPDVETDSRFLINGEWVEVPFRVEQHKPFKSRKRSKRTTVNTILVHQSVTSSRITTEKVLRKKGLGVHIMIDADGSIHQYGDLATQKLAHGNERNGCSIGVEIINPYTKVRGPWKKIVESRTAWKGKEVLDTDAQIASLDAVCAFLCSHDFPGEYKVDIPLSFPTTKATGTSRGNAKWFDMSVGGIIAHGHRPSRYPKGHKLAGKKVSGGHADARMTVYRLLKKMEA